VQGLAPCALSALGPIGQAADTTSSAIVPSTGSCARPAAVATKQPEGEGFLPASPCSPHSLPLPRQAPILIRIANPACGRSLFSSPDSKAAAKSAQMCIDAATEAALMNAGATGSMKMCSKFEVHFEGASGTTDTVCKFGNSTQRAHSKIIFTGDSPYRIETQAHYDPPLFAKTDQTMTKLTEALEISPAARLPDPSRNCNELSDERASPV
jgi:hypothetical protein